MPDSTGNGTDTPEQSPETATDRAAPRSATRRRLLAAGGGAAAVLLAGCSSVVPERLVEGDSGGGSDGGASDGTDGQGGNSTGAPTDTETATASETATGTGTPSPTPTPETDVVSLVTRADGDQRKFIVKLRPPESSAADWWQLETLDGERIHRESFAEPRPEQSTSAATLSQSASAVVVRGHDAAFGYGGQAMLADLESGDLTAVQQGEEPDDFSDFTF